MKLFGTVANECNFLPLYLRIKKSLAIVNMYVLSVFIFFTLPVIK